MEQGKIRFLDVVDKWRDHYYALTVLSDRTKENYKCYFHSIEQFLDHYKKTDIDIKEVDPDLMDDMNVYLRTNGRGMTNTARTIEICKNVCRYAKLKKLVQSNEIADVVTVKAKPKEVVHLEENELQKIIYSETEGTALAIAKDLYVFQALTGLSYGDLWSYKIIKDETTTWLYNKRYKNGQEYWVPFSDIPKAIHEKYNGMLPRIKMKEYNDKIRTIAKQLGFTKYLTSHTARKTFATQMYDKGWSLESIADMLGHMSTNTTTRHYIKKSRKRLENEVLAMKEKTRPVEVGEVVLKIV